VYLGEAVTCTKPGDAGLFESDFPAGEFLGRELIPIAGFSAADYPLADSNNDSGLATGDPSLCVARRYDKGRMLALKA
jgi:hypothetical protein